MRSSLVTSVLLLACSGGSTSRPPAPAPAPLAPPAAAPAVPAATAMPQAIPPLVVAERDPGWAFRDPARRTKLAAAFPAIEKQLAEEMKRQALPGLAFGIVIDGELAYAKGFGVKTAGEPGTPDADTVYRIGSISKSFTGLALLALRDEGALELDDPLAKWIPEAAGLVYPTRDARPLTLRQLANHTSGLPRMGTFEPETGPTEDIVAKSLAKLPLETTPGTRWSYSNLAFGLLGIAVGRAAKAPYHDVVERVLWRPLGMTATAWDHAQVPADRLAPAHVPGPKGPVQNPKPARLGAIDGAGGIYSSVRDMAKYVAFQLAAYPPRNTDDTAPVRRASVREAHVTGVPSEFQHAPPAVALNYSFGWASMQSCRFDDLVGHGGAIDSHRAEIWFSPSRGVGVIALTNFGMGDPHPFTELALRELAKTGALVPRTPLPRPELEEALRRLLAVYHAWDEAKLKAALGRPLDPREQGELATYKQLHGTCKGFEPARIESPTAGAFALQCERGELEMRLVVDGTGRITGFVGFSRGVTPPPAFPKLARTVLALHQRWDPKVFARHFAKGPMSAEQVRGMASRFGARHGTCKLAEPLHEGFDWGYRVACSKESLDMYITTAPDDPTQVTGVQLRPVRDAPAQCD